MKIFIVLAIIIFFYIIFCSNIKIELNFKRNGKDDILNITIIVLYGIFRYNKQIPFLDLVQGSNNVPALEIKANTEYNEKHKKDNKSVVNINEFERIIDKYTRIYKRFKEYIIPFIENIKEKITLKNIKWNTEIGLDDAAQTAVITGIIWSIKSLIISFIYSNYNLYDSYINVVPNYNTAILKTSIDCIFTIKVGDIINVGIKTLLAKTKDGGKNE